MFILSILCDQIEAAIRISNANSSIFLNIQEQIVFHKMINAELKYVLKWVLL